MKTGNKVLVVGVAVLVLVVVVVGGIYLLWRPHIAEIAADPRIDSLHQLEQASQTQPELYFQNGFPRYVHVQIPVEGENSVDRAQNFLQEYQEMYRQDDPALELHVRRITGDEDEFVILYQTYLGIEVYGSEFLVMVNGEQVNATIGGLLPAGVILDTYPLVDADQATAIARESVGRSDAFVVGAPTIMVYDPSILNEEPSEPHLVWRIPLGPGSTHLVYVDAHNGEIVLDGQLSFEGYELDHEDANGYPDGNVDCYWYTTADDWIGDEDGLISEYVNDVEAANSWWYARNAYSFFRNEYGRDSYDNDGGELELYIYSGTPNARWVGGTGCDLIEFRQGWVGWDIMVHELAHGVQFYTSQIGMHGGYGQAFSLKESLADIQSIFADPDDWLQGDNRTGMGGYVRNIQSPDIDHRDNYDTSGTKSAGYKNSGIPSKAAYLTAVGGTQDFFLGPGLGIRNMGHLYYGTMVALPSNAQFYDARNLAMAIAAQHFTPNQVCTVQNAWAMVGVGTADVGCDGVPDPDLTDTDSDYTIDTLDNCPEIYNPYQEDFEGDGIGDACDIDDDNDGVTEPQDNCQFVKNPDQGDFDNDGVGDLCDDEDGDHVLDFVDNCQFVPNPNQVDSDDDGFGNACDKDLDGDGVNEYEDDGFTMLDNCPFKSNPDQADSDGDGIGDGCDGCPNDADTNQAYTAVDPFLASLGALPKPYQPDSDGDGIPDACDGNILVDDARFMTEEFNWRPDGLLHEMEVSGEPGSFLNVPIPICQPEDKDWIPRNYRGKIVLEGLDERVGVWLGDAAGFGAGKTKFQDGQRIIDFAPRGGLDYYLLIGFHSEYPSDLRSQFSIRYECYQREDEGSPPGEGFKPEELIPGPPPVRDQAPLPTQEEALPTEEPTSRCDLFDGEYPLTMLDIPTGSTALTLFIEIPGGVPGLEIEIPGDDYPWVYSARLDEVSSELCSYQGYAARLYCDFMLPESFLDTVQPLAVYVNRCDEPIFEHPRVSIFAPEPILACVEELEEEDCNTAGGTYVCTPTGAGVLCTCQCP